MGKNLIEKEKLYEFANNKNIEQKIIQKLEDKKKNIYIQTDRSIKNGSENKIVNSISLNFKQISEQTSVSNLIIFFDNTLTEKLLKNLWILGNESILFIKIGEVDEKKKKFIFSRNYMSIEQIFIEEEKQMKTKSKKRKNF